jgi:hypothetical protein
VLLQPARCLATVCGSGIDKGVLPANFVQDVPTSTCEGSLVCKRTLLSYRQALRVID